jgi:hypothetical protein
MLTLHKVTSSHKVPREVGTITINKNLAWGYFDGTCQGMGRVWVGFHITFFKCSLHFRKSKFGFKY